MRKNASLVLLFVFTIFAVSGCQAPAKRTTQVPLLEPEEMVNIYYLAGKLGMTVSQEEDEVTLSDKNNTVTIYPKVDQVYINNNYLTSLGRTKKIDDMLHVRSTLEDQIRDNLKKAKIRLIIPKPFKPAKKIYPAISGTKITIDAGHGGKDPGAISSYGYKEKTVNLDVALQVAQILRDKGHRVIMTRDSDEFIELEERAAIANRSKADIFVSIHADSCATSSKNGFTIYVARSGSSASTRLANAIDNCMAQTGISSNSVRQADYRVLTHTNCPAVLIELGYLSNYWEAKQLKNVSMQKRLANSIANGITDYLERR